MNHDTLKISEIIQIRTLIQCKNRQQFNYQEFLTLLLDNLIYLLSIVLDTSYTYKTIYITHIRLVLHSKQTKTNGDLLWRKPFTCHPLEVRKFPTVMSVYLLYYFRFKLHICYFNLKFIFKHL